MAELHPFFVHFPIAILVVAALFDLYGVIKNIQQHTWTAYALQLMAGVSAIFAAITGHRAESLIVRQEALLQGVTETFNRHISLGNAMVWIIVIAAVGRTFAVLEKKEWALRGWRFPLLSLGLAVLILITGLLGGQLSHEILSYFKAN
ncbi:MAG: hypothetical protein K9M55_02525 [Candidatus Marinimicrobia bacterium]|nr:hypothetical protein [Candidatus Neomarinimicrobiota bacterium]MCF7921555.1 hypothetical protein [Candidatus Neomarinimicrobiota bacterium]